MRLARAVSALVITSALLASAACSGGDEIAETTGTPPPVTTSSSSTTPSSVTLTPPPTSTTTSSTTSTTTTPPAPAGPVDPLTGKEPSKNPVIAAKIDNTSFPQFGVADADIIYTEQVEGGLTRLIALYHSVLPQEVGPVRSIRSTDLKLLPSYGPILLVNSGGNTVNLRALRASTLVGVAEGAAGFWRSKDRYAPYNLHASIADISKNHSDQPKAVSPGFEFAVHDDHLKTARKVPAIDVTMMVGQTSFKQVTGGYQAYHGGSATPYVDADGRKVQVQNVIVQHVRDEPDGTLDPIGTPAYITHTTGSGKFTLYRDGRAVDGTWSRKNDTDPTVFLGADGKPVKLAPGKTWIVLAPQNAVVNKG